MKRILPGVFAAALAAALCPGPAPEGQEERARPAVDFERQVLPILAKFCFKCHGLEKTKGDLDLMKIKTPEQVLANVELWQKVVERLNAFEMPPDKSPQPSFDEKGLVNRWFGAMPKGKLDCNQLATDRTQRFYRGYAMSRRLNRTEYANSVRDLIGLDLDAGRSIPSDGSGGEGFDNNGDALFTSPLLVEKYLDAAERVLGTVFPDAKGPPPSAIAAARERLLAAAPPEGAERDRARKIVESFAARAFRRPLEDGEAGKFLSMFDRARRRGDSFDASLRLALKAVLISPQFLFLIEPEPKDEGVYRLGAFQVAQRISYFLWSSIPDEELLRVAADGRIFEPWVLRAQVRRMLKDPRSRALGEGFALQWLELEPLGRTVRPDPKKFPDFDDELAESMKSEAVHVFHDLVSGDRSLLELIDSDSTYVNARLAKLYGLEGVEGPEMRRVVLNDPRRGGVVGMAAVLASTSYPLRTSPVIRGKWVLQAFLGGKVNPPPANAGSLPETGPEGAKLTLRERLEKHRSNPECAACHSRMDPLGFGLENFDPLGRWRTQDDGLAIDSAGRLPSGEKFAGVIELKKMLMARRDEVLSQLSRKLLGYALGRSLNNFDKCVIDESLKALQANEYRASALLETIVLSYPFQHRYAKK